MSSVIAGVDGSLAATGFLLLISKVSCGRWPRGTTEAETSSAIRGCHEEGSGGGTTFRDLLKLPGHTKLIPWPDIRAAAAECALDRQAWRDAIKNLAPLEFQKPKQTGRLTWSCARRGGSG
eukprot:364787-Chlamydomonas_euryale.AAC.15